MANEATEITKYGENGTGRVASYTCAAGKTISKGTILCLVADNTVSAHSLVAQAHPVGIAAMTKDGTDGSTTISVLTDLEAGIIASEALVLGGFVKLAAVSLNFNTVQNALDADITLSRNIILGKSLAATAAGSRGRIRINL